MFLDFCSFFGEHRTSEENIMPPTQIVFYKDDDNNVPILEWLDNLPPKAQNKCFTKLKRLSELGYELRRPEADYLRDKIYELRIGLQGINYRILYFFHENTAAIISHGIVKKKQVAPEEIDKAAERRQKFISDPKRYTYQEE
jgi:phage-related protein